MTCCADSTIPLLPLGLEEFDLTWIISIYASLAKPRYKGCEEVHRHINGIVTMTLLLFKHLNHFG